MSYKLVTLTDVKQMSKGDLKTDFDSLIDGIIIPAVGQMFANYCRRPDFDKIERTVYLSPRSSQTKLFLNSPPVAASPAVQVWENHDLPRAYAAADLLVNGTDYIVHEDLGIIERYGHFAGGAKSVKVTYTGGYLTADGVGCPADVRLAALAQAKILFDRREEFGVTGRSVEGSSVTVLQILTLPRQVTMMLDPYRVDTI